MDKTMEALSGAFEIIGRDLAVVSEGKAIKFPESSGFDISFAEAASHAGKNYKDYNIYKLETIVGTKYVCIQAKEYFESKAVSLVLLAVKLSVDGENSLQEGFKKIVEGKYDAAELVKLDEAFADCLPGYVLLVDNCKELAEEVREILINTVNTRFCFGYESRIVAVSDEEDIESACSSFNKNILSELLIECTVAIGGQAKAVRELKEKYENCLKALYLKNIYNLPESVVVFENMYAYRIAYNLNPELKEYIRGRVFTPEFRDIMSSELGTTIEELFKNNLNLTDTAAKLYIHRNTLLYRLDKIYKSTGFDLKKFEDSWLFKLAWLIRKEQEQ